MIPRTFDNDWKYCWNSIEPRILLLKKINKEDFFFKAQAKHKNTKILGFQIQANLTFQKLLPKIKNPALTLLDSNQTLL